MSLRSISLINPAIRVLFSGAVIAAWTFTLDAQAVRAPLKAPPSGTVKLAIPQGPPPADVKMMPGGGPFLHGLTWFPPYATPGVAGYRIFSTPAANGPWTPRTPGVISADGGLALHGAKIWIDTGFVRPGTMYRVVAVYSDGREGYVDYVYANPPQPVVPTGFVVQQTGPGTVLLSWQPVPHAAFRVFGTGQPASGTLITRTATSFTNLPDGTYGWQLSADYGGVHGPGPTASITLKTITSSRYRVVANGFRVINHTNDESNVLSGSDWGDEIYAGFAMFHVARPQGRVLNQDLRSTFVHGDASRMPNRVKAGTASLQGGLQNTDVFPPVLDPSQRYGEAPNDRSFPFLVWDGTLTNGHDAVIILPTLWESDPAKSDANTVSYTNWFLAEAAELPRVWAEASVQLALQSKTIALTMLNGWTYFTASSPLVGFDHPIGAIYDQHPHAGLGGMGKRLPRRAIILTREMIEAALGHESGIVTIPLIDQGAQGIVGNGHYILYVQVERAP